MFGKVGIDEGQRNAVERQVPGGVPGVFPFVGHGDDVFVIQVPPVAIPTTPAFRWWWRPSGISLQPPAHFIVIKLLTPQQPGKRLPHDLLGIIRQRGGNHRGVELVRFMRPLTHQLDEGAAKRAAARLSIAQA